MDLESLGKKLNAPRAVLEDALIICRNVIRRGRATARNYHITVLASFYASCRKNGFPVALKDLSHLDESSKVDWRIIAHSYKTIVKEMGVEISIADPMQYLSQVATKASISQSAIDCSIGIITKARTEIDGAVLEGKDPKAVAAAALYIATLTLGENAKEKDLADSARITESAVRHSVRALRSMGFVKVMLASNHIK